MHIFRSSNCSCVVCSRSPEAVHERYWGAVRVSQEHHSHTWTTPTCQWAHRTSHTPFHTPATCSLRETARKSPCEIAVILIQETLFDVCPPVYLGGSKLPYCIPAASDSRFQTEASFTGGDHSAAEWRSTRGTPQGRLRPGLPTPARFDRTEHIQCWQFLLKDEKSSGTADGNQQVRVHTLLEHGWVRNLLSHYYNLVPLQLSYRMIVRMQYMKKWPSICYTRENTEL